MSQNVSRCPKMSKNVEKCPSRLWEKMVGNDWENSLKGANSSKSLPKCPKMSQNVPKCPLQTHRCPNGLVHFLSLPFSSILFNFYVFNFSLAVTTTQTPTTTTTTTNTNGRNESSFASTTNQNIANGVIKTGRGKWMKTISFLLRNMRNSGSSHPCIQVFDENCMSPFLQ